MRRPKANKTFIFTGVLLVTLSLCNGAGAQGPINIELSEGNVNLIAEDRQFGEVIDEMAKTISFTVKVPPELRSKRISIRMINTELDRAVTRLFALVQEKNYKVKFDSTGKITNLEVISGKSVRKLPQTGKAEERIVKKREARRSRSRRFSPRRRPSRRYQPQRVEPPEPVNTPPSPVIETPPPVDEAEPPVAEETEEQ